MSTTETNTTKILVLNLGSSSIKFALYQPDGDQFARLASGLLEKIGHTDSRVVYESGDGKKTVDRPIPSHEDGMLFLERLLTDKQYCGVISDRGEISAIGHRVVHGGTDISRPSLIDDQVIAIIRKYEPFAPLHNPVNLQGITIAQQLFPDVPQVAVFDTAFHTTIPDKARIYGLHFKHFENGIRKYGFHGTSHHYVTLEAARLLGVPSDRVNLITCHLGNGSSIAAVERGKSIETSMGFTPLEGLIMGTRCGDIDPAAIFYIMREADFTINEMEEWLNKKSGMYALAGIESADMRHIWEAAEQGNRNAMLALEAFAHRVSRFIGAYAWYLKGDYHIVFTGGIGEKDYGVRELVLKDQGGNGFILDPAANRACKTIVTAPESPRKAFVIHTDEELMIAKQTHELACSRCQA